MPATETALCVELADAVVAALDAGTWSLPLTAERGWAPRHLRQDLADLKLTVVPVLDGIALADRRRDQHDLEVDVAVQQAVDGSNEQIDPLVALVEELGEWFRLNELTMPAGLPRALYMGRRFDPVCAENHLREHEVYTGLLTLTYRMVK